MDSVESDLFGASRNLTLSFVAGVLDGANCILRKVHVLDGDTSDVVEGHESLFLEPRAKDVVVGEILEAILQLVLDHVKSLLDANFLEA